MDKDDVKMSVRVPAGTYDALKELAKKDGRTLQGYVFRLIDAHVARKGKSE